MDFENQAGRVPAKNSNRPISKSANALINDHPGRSGNGDNFVRQERPKMMQIDEINIQLQEISLLTTAEQLIRMCERQVEKKMDRQFDDPNRIQILKFKNVDSYLYGDTQLVYFVEIRKFLRKSRAEKKSLELVFLSLSMSDMRDGFDHDDPKASKLIR